LGPDFTSDVQSIHASFSQYNLELYGPPLSQGSITPLYTSSDSLMIEKPFYIAVTHSAIEDLIETPLIAAYISETYWKKA